MIICSKCRISKIEDKFRKNTKTCKECISKRHAIWRQNNKDKLAAAQKRFYENNPDKRSQYCKKYSKREDKRPTRNGETRSQRARRKNGTNNKLIGGKIIQIESGPITLGNVKSGRVIQLSG